MCQVKGKNMRIAVPLFLTAFLWASPLMAEELPVLKDKALVKVLTNLDILAEKTNVKEMPYYIRVIRVREGGECDGPPETCPLTALYIAASTFGEAPEEQVYVLPKAHDWDFAKRMVLPKKEGRDSFAVLEFVKTTISPGAPGGEIKQRYEVRVNPWKGTLKQAAQ